VLSQVLEGSNVSLTREFGRLILVQRGYQASSQVMSTASEMMQELLSLRDRR
jgi:flagellar hook protein FlgE